MLRTTKTGFITGIQSSTMSIADLNNPLIKLNYKNIGINKRSYSAIQISENIVLIGTIDGICSYNLKEKKHQYLEGKNPLYKSRAIDMKHDSLNNCIWIATNGNGILKLYKDSLYQINEKNGLLSNSVSSLFIEDNVVWASTNNGLNKIEIEDFENNKYNISAYTTKHGLSSNEVNKVKIKDSLIYVATNKGLSIIDQKNFEFNKTPSKIYIENIKINGNDTILSSHFKLNHNQNIIDISFKALNYKLHGNISYRYKLSENQKNWYYTSNTNIQLLELKPGKYDFEIYGSNENGIWSDNPAKVSFIIKPPFWQTWWFIALIIILFVTILIYRTKVYKRKMFLQSELVKIRQQALSSQMNPHFIFNSLNSIQNFILQNDKLASNTFLAKFADLMRKILENSQYTYISVSKELEALELYIELEAMRFKDKFSYEIKIDESINTEEYKIPPLLIQPYIENAIWHGLMHKESEGLLVFEMKLIDKTIHCSIIDNGIGREKAAQIKANKQKTYQSFGTDITKKRLDLINSAKDIQMSVKYTDMFENNIASGTKVEIIFPILT